MENIKKKVQMVISRYMEDVKWLLPFKDIVIIYNKGDYDPLLNNFNIINLKNYGRESHTYLYHIINNYDNLTEKIIFFQGKIDDHKILEIEDYFGNNNFIGKFKELNIDTLKHSIDHFGKWKKDYLTGNMKISSYTPYDWLTKNIGINIDLNTYISKVVWGANFSVSKELILSKPKIFYENILRYLDYHINPEEGHFLERTWYLIFNNTFTQKKKIGYIYINSEFDKFKDILFKITQYEEIHIWRSITPNKETGIIEKINYTPENNKYLIINPKIIDNSLFYEGSSENGSKENEFNISVKCNNNVYILIEFNEENIYEIVLGGWNNTRSVVRDYINNKIIISYENSTLDINKFITFKFIISDIIKIYNESTLIFSFNNIFKIHDIKNIKIKSNFNNGAFWEYNNSSENYEKIKFFLCNSKYYNIDIFYQNNYTDNYIEKINILEYF
jgi:hypothetical protein